MRRRCYNHMGCQKGERTDVADVGPHVVNERFDPGDGSRDDEPAVIEPETYPQVVHEHRESDHHGGDAPWPAELPPGYKKATKWAVVRTGEASKQECCNEFTVPCVRVEEFVGLATFAGDISL